jgi:hypothetical protein
MQRTRLSTTVFRGDVISTNKYRDRQRNKYYQKLIHWNKYYHFLRTGLSNTAADWNKYYHLQRTGLSTTAVDWNKYYLQWMEVTTAAGLCINNTLIKS